MNRNENNPLEMEETTTVLGDLIAIALDALKVIRERIMIFVLIVLFFTAAAFGYSLYSYEPLYKSEATFSILPLVDGDATNGLSVYKFNYSANFATQMANTFPFIISTENFRQIITSDIGRSMNGMIEGTPVVGTNIFVVTVSSSSYQDAHDIMRSFLKNFPNVASYIIGDTKISIIDSPEMPTKPSNSADHLRHTSYGLLFGLALSALLAVIMALRRETIYSKADIKTKLNSFSICELPHIKVKRTSNNEPQLIGSKTREPEYVEAMRVAKKRITEKLHEGEKIIAVTSSVSGEGKTTVAFNMAKAFADGGKNTVLVDLDFYKRSYEGFFYKSEGKCIGVSEYVNGHCNILEAQNGITKLASNLDIVFAGSEAIKYNNIRIPELLRKLAEIYDNVIVDIPPLTAVNGSVSLLNYCDTCVFVVKRDATSLSMIRTALNNISFTKSRLLGVILNDSNGYSSEYNYRKYYGYYGRYSTYSRYSRYNKYSRYSRYSKYSKYSKYTADNTAHYEKNKH